MALLDGSIGYDYWMVFFYPNMGSVVDHSSKGHFLFLRILAPKGHIWSKTIISGQLFLKNDGIWSEFIIFDLPQR